MLMRQVQQRAVAQVEDEFDEAETRRRLAEQAGVHPECALGRG